MIVETVGVGQSEAAVAGMTDLFLLMQLPNAGDDLQAIKKGVLELADLVVVNKADLDPAAAARAVGQLESAMQLSHSREGETARPRGARQQRDRSAAGATPSGTPPPPGRRSGAPAAPSPGGGRPRRAPGCRSGSTPAWPSDSAPTPRSAACWPETLAAVDAGRLPVSVAARALLRAFVGRAGRGQ